MDLCLESELKHSAFASSDRSPEGLQYADGETKPSFDRRFSLWYLLDGDLRSDIEYTHWDILSYIADTPAEGY